MISEEIINNDLNQYLIQLQLGANQLLFEPQRNVTQVVIAAGDRETGKTSAILLLLYERYTKYGELFTYVVRLDKHIKKLRSLFGRFGWKIINEQIFDGDNLVGFVAAVNTYEDSKIAGIRQYNITTVVFEEVVPEIGSTPPNTGEKISSLIATILGNDKLLKWKELNLQIFFLTNNHNSDHPVFYLYGFNNMPEVGIVYKNNQKYAAISLVNRNNNTVDPLLTMGGYSKKAYGRIITQDEDIIIGTEFTFEGWEFLVNVDLSNEFGGLYVNSDGEMLLHEKINEEDDNFICIGNVNKNKVNYKLLIKLERAMTNKILKFSDWKWKKLLNDSLIRNMDRL